MDTNNNNEKIKNIKLENTEKPGGLPMKLHV